MGYHHNGRKASRTINTHKDKLAVEYHPTPNCQASPRMDEPTVADAPWEPEPPLDRSHIHPPGAVDALPVVRWQLPRCGLYDLRCHMRNTATTPSLLGTMPESAGRHCASADRGPMRCLLCRVRDSILATTLCGRGIPDDVDPFEERRASWASSTCKAKWP